MSEAQQNTLVAIQGFIAVHGRGPSLSEISRVIGRTTSAAQRSVSHLIRAGKLRRTGPTGRGRDRGRKLQIVPPPPSSAQGTAR